MGTTYLSVPGTVPVLKLSVPYPVSSLHPRKTGRLVALAGMDKSILEALLTPGLIWPQLLML